MLVRQLLLVLDLAFDGADFLRLLAEGEERESAVTIAKTARPAVAIAVISPDSSTDMGAGYSGTSRSG